MSVVSAETASGLSWSCMDVPSQIVEDGDVTASWKVACCMNYRFSTFWWRKSHWTPKGLSYCCWQAPSTRARGSNFQNWFENLNVWWPQQSQWWVEQSISGCNFNRILQISMSLPSISSQFSDIHSSFASRNWREPQQLSGSAIYHLEIFRAKQGHIFRGSSPPISQRLNRTPILHIPLVHPLWVTAYISHYGLNGEP